MRSKLIRVVKWAPPFVRSELPSNKTLADAQPLEAPLAGPRASIKALSAGAKAITKGNNPVPPAVKAYITHRYVLGEAADNCPPPPPLALPRLSLQSERPDYREMFDAMHRSWPRLLRQTPATSKNSLIPLPNPYIVPGGHFHEMYYWDSYFIMLGLQTSKLNDLAAGMADNMLYLSEQYGIIPNANRTYYLSRSQPPFLTSMIELVAPLKDKTWLAKAYRQAEQEYQRVWMDPKTRFVKDTGLNRYFDTSDKRLPENHKGDPFRIVRPMGRYFRNKRAECESGWDFTRRFDNRSTDFLPVDLNSLLYKTEKDMARFARQLNLKNEATQWEQRAQRRAEQMYRLMWDPQKGMFLDYDFKHQRRSQYESLASFFPLWAGLVKPVDVKRVLSHVSRFEAPGGLKTSLYDTGEQWDGNNGWPCLNWIVIKGVQKHDPAMARRLAKQWLDMSYKVYKAHGTFYEKYNVQTQNIDTAGHYPAQALFGWGIGVNLALMAQVLGYPVLPKQE